MGLKIAKGFEIDLTQPPFDTMGLRAFISGMSGAGKSYTEMKFLEEAYRNKMQFCLLDVHGEGHVLGELGDSVMVASDRFGIPVMKEAIPVYLDALQDGMSLVVDLKPLFFSDEGLDAFFEFMFEFLSKFLAFWSKTMKPILLSFDEAQQVMPQSPPKGIRPLFNKCNQLVLGGRKFGIHYLLASQRTALIDKTPISQANVRLFGKVEEQTDYDAIRPHLKYTVTEKQKNKDGTIEEVEVTKYHSLQEMKQLRSGEFILSSEGEAKKVKILSRKTTDAGATPTFVPTFTDTQKRDMSGIADRIQELIAKAEEERKRKEDEESELARLRRQSDKKDEEIKDLTTKLDLVEFIKEKLGGNGQQAKTAVDMSAVYDEVRAELENELAKARHEYKAQLEAKDAEIARLQERIELDAEMRERIQVFQDAFAGLVGNAPTYAEVDRESIINEVLRRVPVSTGQAVQMVPLDAFKESWQEKAFDSMVRSINEIPLMSLNALHYLIAQDKYVTKGKAMRALGIDGADGRAYGQFNDLLAPLLDRSLIVYNDKTGIKASIDRFVSANLGSDSKDDAGTMRDHVLAAIFARTNGGRSE